MDEKEAIKILNRRINQLRLKFAITNEDLEAIEKLLNLLEKKDKIIDLMTNYICSKCFDDITNRLKDDDIAYWGIEGSIKQYFKEKVENGN